jgi:hypothetical protein
MGFYSSLITHRFVMFRATVRRLLAIDDPPERTALASSVCVFIAFKPFESRIQNSE